MALQNADLFVVQQGNQVFNISASDLRAKMQEDFDPTKLPIATATELGGIRVGNNLTIDPATGLLDATVPDTFTFKGQLQATDTAPAAAGGDFYIFSTGGTLDATWANLQGTNVAINDGVAWDADNGEWDHLPGLFGAGVVSVTGTSPIAITGDAANPVVSINAASDTDAGSMSANDKAKLDGIQPNSDIGTVTEVTGTAPIQVTSGITTPVISVAEATSNAPGVVTLADATAIINGAADKVVTSSQLKSSNDNIVALEGRIDVIEQIPVTNVLGGNSVSVNETPTGTFTVNSDDSTKAAKGVIQLATDAETLAGTDDTKAVTPLDAAAVYLPKDFSALSSV